MTNSPSTTPNGEPIDDALPNEFDVYNPMLLDTIKLTFINVHFQLIRLPCIW